MAKDKCLTPECTREAEVRGICRPCYNTAQNMIEAEETDFDSMEDAGLILPVYKSPMRAAIEALDE